MRIEVNDEIKEIINKAPGNKGFKKSVLKVYAALWILEKRKNKFGYFPVSSTYLKSINVRYFKIIDYFEEVGLIESYKRPFDDPENIFESKQKRFWSSEYGICMRYKFLKDISGDAYYVNLLNKNKKRWYELTLNSLKDFGFDEPWLSRDDYGRRLYHSGTADYKELFKGYGVIDSIASHPRLLWIDLNKKGIVDKDYNFIFENNIDFYDYIIKELKLSGRVEAKELFMEWINGNGWLSNKGIKKLFPIVNEYVVKSKVLDYKFMGSKLQRIESKIWIEDLLENIPVDWALTIHDSLIIKKENIDLVLDYCENKYPQLEFKKSYLE